MNRSRILSGISDQTGRIRSKSAGLDSAYRVWFSGRKNIDISSPPIYLLCVTEVRGNQDPQNKFPRDFILSHVVLRSTQHVALFYLPGISSSILSVAPFGGAEQNPEAILSTAA
jgi:hypothetical protein